MVKRAKYSPLVLVAVVCPDCGFNLNYVSAENRSGYEDGLLGPGRMSCDSCGKKFDVPAAEVQEAQHECLRLLGEV